MHLQAEDSFDSRLMQYYYCFLELISKQIIIKSIGMNQTSE